MLPDFFETEVQSKGYFTFILTAAAAGVESDIVLEISVEYGTAYDGNHLVANAWAREQDGMTKCFIDTVHVDLGDKEPERIFAVLNQDNGFRSTLIQYIAMLERQRKQRK